MKIFITGANGYLGAKYFEFFKDFGHQVSGSFIGSTDNPELLELDISDSKQTHDIVTGTGAEVIIHTAAVAHGQESWNNDLVQRVNVNGTANVLAAAKPLKAKMVFISSISALFNMPYGKSKIQGEEMTKVSGLEYLILRPSVTIGVSPNREADITFNKILKAIKTRQPMAEDNHWKFHPTWLSQTCEIINGWLKGDFNDPEPIYPILPEVKTRYEISRDILSQFGVEAQNVHSPRYEADALPDISSLARNHLPVYGYQEAILAIVSEIKGLM